MNLKGTENIQQRLIVTKELIKKGIEPFDDAAAQRPTLRAFDFLCAELLRERKSAEEERSKIKKIKRLCIALSVCLLIAVASCGFLAVKGDLLTVQYIGSTSSDKYHKPSCEYAEKIYDGYLVHYASAEAAERDGRTPCALCLPKK